MFSSASHSGLLGQKFVELLGTVHRESPWLSGYHAARMARFPSTSGHPKRNAC